MKMRPSADSYLHSDGFSRTLLKLYGPRAAAGQKQRYIDLVQRFKDLSGGTDPYLFSTPGRTEISGNHTDHNHGRVLAAAVNPDSSAAAVPREGGEVILHSAGYPQPFRADISDLRAQKEEQGTTTALIRGIAAGFKNAGLKTGGFFGLLSSDVPVGSGLSSSASVEVLIATVFNEFYNEGSIDPLTLARICQYAENRYFGKPCGLMDQTACAAGGIIAIDFARPDRPDVRPVTFDFSARGYDLLVVETGGSHAGLTADYAAIPAEMKRAAAFFGQETLRGVGLDTVMQSLPQLRRACGDRAVLRALHFLQENERVGRQTEALEAGDLQGFLSLVSRSGDSSFKYLQNIYPPGRPDEQSVSLALALTESFIREHGEGACRVHGGGFAGTIQVFLPRGLTPAYRTVMGPVFGEAAVRELMIRQVGTICLNCEVTNIG